MKQKRKENYGSLAPARFLIVTRKTGFLKLSLIGYFAALLGCLVSILGLVLKNIEGIYFIFLYGRFIPTPKKIKKVRRPQRYKSNDPALMTLIYNPLTLHS